ncbi:hypothetical protein BGW38_009650, partial [Lunasporangiospora selenospora]
MTKMVRDLMSHLKTAGWQSDSNLYHVPCLGHIINLAIQAILGPGGLDDQPPETNSLYRNEDDNEEAAAPPTIKLTPLKKLRKGIVRVRSSSQRIQNFERICDIVKCPKLELLRDVRHRWNSTYVMLDRAIVLKEAYQSMCQNET